MNKESQTQKGRSFSFRYFGSGLRFQMRILFSVVSIIIVLGTIGIASFLSYQQEKNAWQQVQYATLNNVTNALYGKINEDLIKITHILNHDTYFTNPYNFTQLFSEVETVKEIIIIDANGQKTLKAPLGNDFLANLTDQNPQALFPELAQGKEQSLKAIFSPQEPPLIVIAVPAPNEQILIARLDIQTLSDTISNIQLGQNSNVYIVDQTGQLIYSTNTSEPPGSNITAQPIVQSALSSEEPFTSGYTNAWGKMVLGTSQMIGDTGWVVITETLTNEVYRGSRNAILILTLCMVLFLIFIVPIVRKLFSIIIMTPVEVLRAGAERLGKGELEYRIGRPLPGEMDDVARAFNHMAQALQYQTDQLTQQASELQSEIAQRSRIEHELRRLNEELEDRAQFRARELNQTTEQLVKEMAERQEIQARLQALVDNIPAVTYITRMDKDMPNVYISPQIFQLLGVRPEEWISDLNAWTRRLHPEDRDRVLDEAAIAMQNGGNLSIEYRLIGADNQVVWVHDRAVILDRPDGVDKYLQGVLVDISSRKKTEAQLIYYAYHDQLTGLFNRTWLTKKLEELLVENNGAEEATFSLLYMDLDRFKVINDSLGHRIGDKLLVEVSKILKAILHAGDDIVRLGGDEFVILSTGRNHRTEAIRLADRIMVELRNPFVLEGSSVFTSASIGVVIGNNEYRLTEEILRDADIAMYRAKARGKACYEVFAPSLRDQIINRAQLEGDLRRAIDQGELHLYFQPIISLQTNQITGFEALIRWITPTHGMVLPAEFMPLAVETGLIQLIDFWVIENAVQQIKHWQDRYPLDPAYTISINLSAVTIQNPNLLDTLVNALDQTGLPASSLKLELTEGMFLEDGENTINLLNYLRNLGIQIQIDDFGTGYSSLSYLQRFPINAIKIDRSFTNRIGTQESGTEIIQAIITLAHDLGMETIAEGIETLEQLHWLKEADCNSGQGFLLYKPMDQESLENLLKSLSLARV